MRNSKLAGVEVLERRCRSGRDVSKFMGPSLKSAISRDKPTPRGVTISHRAEKLENDRFLSEFGRSGALSACRSGFDDGKAVAAVTQTGIVETGVATKI